MGYVDGFVLAVAKDRLDEYREMARQAGVVWKEKGALAYVECLADDVPDTGLTSFPHAVQATADEVVIFAWVIYSSRAERDRINEAAMKDPRVQHALEDLPFDPERMIYGGFESFVEVLADTVPVRGAGG